jgi:hypothetical protein
VKHQRRLIRILQQLLRQYIADYSQYDESGDSSTQYDAQPALGHLGGYWPSELLEDTHCVVRRDCFRLDSTWKNGWSM